MKKTNKLLLLALGVGLAFHGSAIFFTLESTYDALVHLFFADHYQHSWFDAWEPRWYTGFTVQGYPPLVHQLIALLAMAGGLKFGLFTVAIIAVLLFLTGVYRFSKMLTGSEVVAGSAALLAVFSSAFIETLHLFGQLPSIFGLSLLFHALPEIYQWILHGRMRYFWKTIALIGVTVCSHHVTPIFGMVFFIFPTIALALMDGATAIEGSLKKVTFKVFLGSFRIRFWRIVGFGLSTLAVIVTFILPYWLNTKKNPITQVPIPHGSRDNFLEVTSSGLVFFLVPWGIMLLILPYLFYRFYSKRYLFFGLSLTLLTLLGTGGTTPLPRMILGASAFDILTLDRFTLWATMMCLPITAEFCHRFLLGDIRKVWIATFGKIYHRLVGGGLVLAILFMVVFSMSLGYFRPSQPQKIKMLPIVNFLNQDQHDQWRYLTLGFGDQMAWLSAQTRALTVDGNYHSARRLPELTTRAVERLENSKYRGLEGLGSLQQFLTVPEKFNLKFIFSNDKFYDPLLHFCGWKRLQLLENGVMVWERAGVPPLPALRTRPPANRLLNIWWGTVPMGSLVLAYLAFVPWKVPWVRRIAGKEAAASLQPESEYTGVQAPLLSITQFWGWSLALLFLGVYVVTFLVNHDQVSPENTLEAYYDALDFKEFERSYGYLSDQEGLTLDQYLLQLSVGDGLLSSYAKLESMHVEVLENNGSSARARVRAKWITPLEVFEKEIDHDLLYTKAGWVIVPKQIDPSLPPEQLLQRRELTYYNHGRRRITTEQTYHEDVLRQPRIQVFETGWVVSDEGYSVVGWARNDDALPAAIQVGAQLRGKEGGVLARYNAQQLLKHELFPGEATPFRVRFQEIAWISSEASKPVTFNPGEFQPLTLAESPDEFAVAAIGNVETSIANTALNLEVSHITPEGIQGMIYNSGIREATVVQLLISFYNQNRELIWVDAHYMDAAVRVQRSQPFYYPLPDLGHVQSLAVPKHTSRETDSAGKDLRSKLIPAKGKGFSYIHIKVNPYVGAFK